MGVQSGLLFRSRLLTHSPPFLFIRKRTAMDIKKLWEKIKNSTFLRGVAGILLIMAMAMAFGSAFACFHLDAFPLGIADWIVLAFAWNPMVRTIKNLIR